jgi:mRNA interferase MazF
MGEARGIKIVRRGEIYLVSFDPTLGGEIQKTRPALVVQNDITNRYSPITIVAAITSTIDTRPRPTKVLVKAPEGGLSVDSMVLLNQIRSVDKQRLLKRLGKLSPSTMEDVNRALLISFGLVAV